MKKINPLILAFTLLVFALLTIGCNKKVAEEDAKLIKEETQPIQMIYVPGGTFHNGTSDVTVSNFYIGKYEITQAEYEAVMGFNPASGFGDGTYNPVYYVTWYDAIEYCNRRSIIEELTPCYNYDSYDSNPDDWPVGWNRSDSNHTNVVCSWTANGYRLPTAMEWMFAAKGGNQSMGYTYSGSNDIDQVAWYFENSERMSHDVGSKAPNELGIYDMSGNVWEWVWDIHDDYPNAPQTDPRGPNSGTSRVVRGGSWFFKAIFCTISIHWPDDVTNEDSDLGFRVCRTAF